MNIAKTYEPFPLFNKVRNLPKSVKYHKKAWIIGLLIATLITVTLGFALCETEWDEVGGLWSVMYGMIDSIVQQSSVADTEAIVEITATGNSIIIAGNEISNMNMVDSVNKYCFAVGILLAVISLTISWVNVRNEHGDYMEVAVKKLLLLVVTIVFMVKAKDICYAIMNVGAIIAEKVAGYATDGTASVASENIKKTIFNDLYVQNTSGINPFTALGNTVYNIVSPLGYVFELLIPWLASKVAYGLVFFTCWSRALEVIVLSTFSPLAFTELAEPGRFGQGNGSRFVRNICALALSGAIILFVMAISNVISASVIEHAVAGGAAEFIATAPKIAVLALAQAGMILKSQSVSKTLCGLG